MKPTKCEDSRLALYEIIEPLGRGANSFVFRAKVKSSLQTVAIKVLDTSSPAKKTEADEEARFHSRLPHKGFVKLLEEFSDESNKYLVLEFCELGELYTYLKRSGTLDEKEALEMLRTLLEALEFLHEKNLVHRDIKLGNIFLTKSKVPRIGDFGLMKEEKKESFIENADLPAARALLVSKKDQFLPRSKLISQLPANSVSKQICVKNYNEANPSLGVVKGYSTSNAFYSLKRSSSNAMLPKRSTSSSRNKKITGTPNYVSPEIILKGNYSEKSDIWALGCVFYALLHGCLPFEGRSTEETFDKILSGKLEIDQKISKKSRKLLGSMLELDPALRGSARSLLQFLNSANSHHASPSAERKDFSAPSASNLRPVRSKLELNRLLSKDKFVFQKNKIQTGAEVIREYTENLPRSSTSHAPKFNPSKQLDTMFSLMSLEKNNQNSLYRTLMMKESRGGQFGSTTKKETQFLLQTSENLRQKDKNDVTAATSDEM